MYVAHQKKYFSFLHRVKTPLPTRCLFRPTQDRIILRSTIKEATIRFSDPVLQTSCGLVLHHGSADLQSQTQRLRARTMADIRSAVSNSLTMVCYSYVDSSDCHRGYEELKSDYRGCMQADTF